MEILSDVVNYLLSLGAAIFVPIIIIIAGLIVRMKLKDDNIRRYYTGGSVYRDDDADQFYDGGNFTGCGSDAEKYRDISANRRWWLDHNVNHFLVLAICVPNVSTHDCHQYNHAGY